MQDKYHKRLTDKGYDLERGIKGSDRNHIKIKDYKKINRKLEQNLNIRNDRLDKIMNDFDKQMETTKNIPFNKTHVLVEKETFDNMNNVIKETKKVIEFQPKLEQLFNEVDTYTKSHQTLEKENKNLTKENNNLKSYIKFILEVIKHFFRELLQIGNDKTKDLTTSEIKDYYDNKDFDMLDVKDISKETTKEDELFDYASIPSYFKTSKETHNDRDKEDFEISL